jgi:hypothetical protein
VAQTAADVPDTLEAIGRARRDADERWRSA